MTLLSITSNAQASKVKHYLSITHKVTDYTKWKLVFDETKSDRTEAGIEDIFVKKDINNTNYITFLAEVKNLAKAKAFTSSTTLKEDMIKAGVASAPEIVYYTAAKEYNAINTSALGTIITHSVKEYAAWMDIYESVEDLRINDGLIDHLILKSLSDENVVTVGNRFFIICIKI